MPLWIDEPSVVRPRSPLPIQIAKIEWQSREHVYWMQLTEPTFQNLLAGIDKATGPGVRFRMLSGTTREGTRLLQHHPQKPLLLAEMIRITNSLLVQIWWSVNPPREPMHLLFCYYHRKDTPDSTPPLGEMRFAPHDNGGPPPDASDHGSASSHDGPSSDGHQPESPAAAGKGTTSTRTTWSANTTKKDLAKTPNQLGGRWRMRARVFWYASFFPRS